ncbi:hypothetical protein Trydic_g1219 [Trypoxylus dichotomus]
MKNLIRNKFIDVLLVIVIKDPEDKTTVSPRLHNNAAARIHVSGELPLRFKREGWSYSPNSFCEYHLFGPFRPNLGEKRFPYDCEGKEAVVD